jgi:flagellar basal body-associated protein FliL
MKFLKGFLVFILIAIIVGGVGYIGYSFLFMGGMDHSGNNTTAAQTQQPAGTNANQNQQNTQGMQHGSTNDQAQKNNQQSNNNQIALNQSNIILQNKDSLDKSIALINESQRLMSVDPYAPSSSTSANMGGMNMQTQPQTENTSVQPAQGYTPVTTNPGNNTTINIYPQGANTNTQSNTTALNGMMPNMGTTYDAAKMEQLHSGLYKIAVGRALLDQLDNELVYQAEYATGNAQNPVQYYSNQYSLTVQNKNKLNQALTYINEAANLVNINPYLSANGLVYDKDRMNQIHQSILKLAEGVATLNLLSDNFTRQTIFLSSTVQNYLTNVDTSTQQTNHTAMSTGLFDNINMSTVINIILILFVVGLIAGIFGFIFSLLKSPSKKAGSRLNEDI